MRLSCGWAGFLIGGRAMGARVGAGAVDVDPGWEALMENERTGAASGLPSERSPMLGTGHGSGVQY